MTLYQRISPVYEAVKYEPFSTSVETMPIWHRHKHLDLAKSWFFYKNQNLNDSDIQPNWVMNVPYIQNARGEKIYIPPGEQYILTNTATGERSVVSREEFEREFREVEG